MDWQVRTGDTVGAKSREMTGRSQTMPYRILVAGRKRDKDDRKQKHSMYIGHVACIGVEMFIPQPH